MATKLSPKGAKVVPAPGEHFITVEEAAARIKNYRTAMKKGDKINPKIEGGTYNRDIFDHILQNPEVCAIRYYFAMVDSSTVNGNPAHGMIPTIVLIGVDKDGNDILERGANFSSMSGAAKATSFPGGESSWPNPPHSGLKNTLNSN